ncbi:hypothetical protein [Pseudovibrio sp. POLY-S9]|uniref:hypothetical protein n=1 Tax=Pseudovibrio sp. POLY-S9 TaxID=1576596 RepID=UPI00070D4A2B|nr:hypothetical protein [Pseudovibrio sp. POLY-S9]
MSFIKTIAPIICAFFLVASPALADGEETLVDLTTKQNIDNEMQFLDDFIQGLKRDRDGAGNLSFGQCIDRARAARIACQQRAVDGVGSEECYYQEDRAREWCARAWGNILP